MVVMRKLEKLLKRKLEATKAFYRQLSKEEDVEYLRDLAARYFGDTDESIAIYLRILDMKPDDANATANAAWAYFLRGDDTNAKILMKRCRESCPEQIDMLLLEAAMTKRQQHKIRIYKKVLRKDPENKVALTNLETMEKGEDRPIVLRISRHQQ